MFDGLDQLLEFVKLARAEASSTRRAVTAQIVGVGDEGDDTTAERVSACEVVQPLGLTAVPVPSADTEALVARVGDRPVVLAVLDKGRSAQAAEMGETRLYGAGDSNHNAVVRIRAAGQVEVTSQSGTDVVLNGGSLKVARVSDAVLVGTLAGVAPPGGGAVTFTFTPFDASGAPGTPVVNATVTIAAVIANSGGATRVKA